MSGESPVVVPCPAVSQKDALAIVLRDVTVAERSELIGRFISAADAQGPLNAAIEDGALVDAAWGQLQPGNTAYFWQPQSSDATAQQLTQSVVRSLDALGVRMTQAIVLDHTALRVPVLEAAGFRYLADLVYLSWPTSGEIVPPSSPVSLEGFRETQRPHFAALIEATYAQTQDCPAMNGRRPMDEVLSGYQATGDFRPDNWRIARCDGDDVGVLLLADHGATNFWELMYMGIVPGRRGSGYGREIVRHAQQIVRDSRSAEQLLVAVDAANSPALRMYESAGFVAWDRRVVFVRFNERAS